MKTIRLLILLSLTIGFLGCKDDAKADSTNQYIDAGTSTFYLIRHAEKDRSNVDNLDPELSQKGLGRAMHWAEILSEVPIDVIYATDFQRTAMTAAPTSVKKDVDVIYYDPSSFDINQFKSDNLNKSVLVVGHSNTTPELTNQLLGVDKYYELDDSDNGSLFIVQITNGVATSQKLNFNCNCPD
ncbi:histidine phosphatase family protein [Aurantibacter crassamenti]|uniref:phosphoglycerate mutase family protein n=1 Tax=Aurantibacter crassamenti TaxID=1837375 RepID=UPI00193A8B89|nr:phosphoglycerate mutase family protein [Aurantibacter crassamenti]MBM1107462.1 histidine phosphatase family protein [Aurantibacter crassamenti]